MSIRMRFLREGEEDAAAALMRRLPKDLGLDVTPKITGASLRDAKDVAEITVAEDTGLIVAVCLWTMTYSSWRGMKGIYVSDLYVLDHVRGRKVGEKLLRFTMQEATKRGAGFIKMEVDQSNEGAQRFYQRLGFTHKPDDQFYVLEPDQFTNVIAGSST
jgi:ribosomal protein S18 acetylase RimI-like enzyme